MIKNKIYAVALMLVGVWITLGDTSDLSALFITMIIGLPMLFSKTKII